MNDKISGEKCGRKLSLSYFQVENNVSAFAFRTEENYENSQEK
jgi:hypothetical protein